MSMFAVTKPSAQTTVIAFGENVLGGPEALELAALVRDSCTETGAVVVFDLERVRVMNSSGLGMLVGALATVRKLDSRLVLASIPEKVQSLLSMTQLSKVFDARLTVEEALQIQ
ncbi:MAG: STAS domain-containing protein [Candidatus Kapabacteria bacterium]|nr:STAS domain-containing protein [Candidatus Kapabacteria bacterium]